MFGSPIRKRVMEKINKRIEDADAEYNNLRVDAFQEYEKKVADGLETIIAKIIRNLF